MQLVSTPSELAALAQKLAGAGTLFLDTEFESNRGGVTLCLLQVSRGDEAFLVDALALNDLRALAAPFAAASSWVLHAGQQDVALIGAALELERKPSVFDTQVAWALTSVEYSVSLAYAQFRVLGLRGKKGHQADDWVRRPLPPSQLAYAAADVEHLPALHAHLQARATELGRAELVPLASAEVIWPEASPPQPLALESFRNAWQLDQREQAALTFIIDWFNGLPEADRSEAPENKTLLAIAARLPRSVDDLLRIKGVPRRWSGAFAEKFVRGLLAAADRAGQGEFVPIDPPPYATVPDIAVDGWLGAARAKLCTELSLAPELVLPARIMKTLRAHALAHGTSGLAGALSGYRRELLGAALERFARELPLVY